MRRLLMAALLVLPASIYAQEDSVYANPNAGPIRILSAVGGAAVGTVAGAFIGLNAFSRECGCDDPGLENLIYGGLAGIAIGAGIGAALPNLRSVCDVRTRLTRSLIGSSLAGAAGFLVSGTRSAAVLFVVPVASIGGSLGALGRCWKSKR